MEQKLDDNRLKKEEALLKQQDFDVEVEENDCGRAPSFMFRRKKENHTKKRSQRKASGGS